MGHDGTTASAPGGALGRVTASFGNPRGSDGPSRGGALAEGSAFQEPRVRGRDRIRFLDGTTAGAPGGAFGRVAASFGNPRGTDSPSGGGALAEGSVLEEPRSLPTRYFLEQRPDPNLFHLKSLHHAAPPELSCPSASARKVDHFGYRPLEPVPRNSPDSASFPDALANLTLAKERPGSSQYVVPKKGKTKATIGQRESTLGTPPVIDDGPQKDDVVDYGDGGSDSPMDDRQTTALEFTRTSAAMSETERALCHSRLKMLFPEVERARAAVRAAEEAGEAAKEITASGKD